MIEQMDGRCMRTFVTVLEEKSFSKAAVRLGYVQSTVTAHIAQLEQLLGKQLFRRMPRGVEPTEAGREVAPFAYRFLRLGESLQNKLNGLDEPKGVVRLRALESFCVAYMPKLLPLFFEQYPHIQLHLETGFHADITQDVSACHLDLGIVPRDPESRHLSFHPLCRDELVWIASKELAHRIECEGWIPSVEHSRVIGFGGRCIYQTAAGRLLADMGISAYGSLEFDSLEMIKQTVACGMGLALLPWSTVSEEIASGRLAQLAGGKQMPLMHGLVDVKGRELTAPAKALRAFLLTFFREKGGAETG